MVGKPEKVSALQRVDRDKKDSIRGRNQTCGLWDRVGDEVRRCWLGNVEGHERRKKVRVMSRGSSFSAKLCLGI